MERFIQKHSENEFSYSGALWEVLKTLYAYEDTGLTPEQIEAQQQEIDRLNADLERYTVELFNRAKEAEDKVKALTADKEEQAGRIMGLEKLAKDLYFAYINKDPDCQHNFEAKAVEEYHAMIGGGEG